MALPTGIINDLAGELHLRVADQIRLKTNIVDCPKDKFLVSLGALSAVLGQMSALFSFAYGLPMDPDLGRVIVQEILELGHKARAMTDEEWAAYAKCKKARA